MKWGIDVSRWQGNFNFAKAKQEGVEFAILKAGGGDAGLYKDGKFDRNYTECMKNNIPAGAYFFGCAMDTATAIKEADYFCKLIAGRTYPMKVWYDVEAKMLKSKYLANIVVTFIERVKSYGYECGIYASASTLKTLCKTPAINNTDKITTSINVAPRLNDFPDNTGNIASSGIDNKSWNNNTENI
jgi:GH25 family lysozyme M1 (1,4-beta-N-acetylmuramidase)